MEDRINEFLISDDEFSKVAIAFSRNPEVRLISLNVYENSRNI